MIYSGYHQPNGMQADGHNASEARQAARSAQTEVERLGHEVERLLMITEALWDMVKEKHGTTDDDLMRRVAEIDLRDGKLDGKVAKNGPVQCPQCRKTINRRHSSCIYCGTQIVQHPFSR